MKIQLDFDNKIVTIEDMVDLEMFFEKLKKIIPEWKDWKLDTNPCIYYTNSPIEYTNTPFDGTYVESKTTEGSITYDSNDNIT